MDKITFNFRIDRATRDEFKKVAEANGTNATTLLTQWIEDYIASNSKDSTDNKDRELETAKTNVSANNETTDIEKIANAQTEELNKLWGAIFQHEKELKKLNAKMHRRKDEIDEKVDRADLLNYFSGWSVPANQENSLADRIDKLENNTIDRAFLDGLACNLSLEFEPQKPTEQTEDDSHQETETEPYSSLLEGESDFSRKERLVKEVGKLNTFYHPMQHGNQKELAEKIIKNLNRYSIYEEGKALADNDVDKLKENFRKWQKGNHYENPQTTRSKYYWAFQLWEEIKRNHTDIKEELES